ncbi:DUF6975 family protein [Sphingomonas floccifaciens]|uniref:DUF6975 family protein n=1 Tax=Sphingomonas floccifaciens TaxID=1844115 RepID=A0ABW4NCJ3_9SPHN
MILEAVESERAVAAWSAVTSLVDADGTGAEAYGASLLAPDAATRDLADFVHCLCLLHGRQPGLVDAAAARPLTPGTEPWLIKAADAFAGERAMLVRLVAAVGPLPSTPGQAETEAAIAAQRHALDMLAASDRPGCPIGAALALIIDWAAIRNVLDAVAVRLGLDLSPSTLPSTDDAAALVTQFAGTAAFERAMLFGSQQLLAQHHALWQLLEARAAARNDA